LDEIEPTINPAHNKQITILEDKNRRVGVIMRYPKLDLAVKLSGKTKLENDPMLAFEIVKTSIEYIFENDSMHASMDVGEKEVEAFLESLTQEQFMRITKFFETMPKLEHEAEAFNPCTQQQQRYLLKGLQDFFRSSSATTAS
jgi:uncharacterized protein YehS (DUF1456 family)